MTIAVSIPTGQAECLGSLVSSFQPTPFSDADIDAALCRPIRPDGAVSAVEDCIQPGESVCLVVSDQTRKTAVDRILPVLMRYRKPGASSCSRRVWKDWAMSVSDTGSRGLRWPKFTGACGKAPKSTVRRPCLRASVASARY